MSVAAETQSEKMKHQPAPTNEAAGRDRRRFFRRLSAIALGIGATLVPLTAAALAFLNPLRSRARTTDSVRVTRLDGLPSDGTPRRFPVRKTHQDAWTRAPDAPVGAVYVRRTGPETVEALNVICPHAGCVVRYVTEANEFQCPCHKSHFDLQGRIIGPGSPSPRDLDMLEAEVRPGGEVWVRFQNFRPGRPDKLPV
jgi:menaquinol-cytochrome c reductase iron-sulfur subunit